MAYGSTMSSVRTSDRCGAYAARHGCSEMARRTRNRQPVVYNGSDPAHRAAARLAADPFPAAVELRDGLQPAAGCVDLFTGELFTNAEGRAPAGDGSAQLGLF